ncbi:MAG: BrnT family toxin [Selenomonadaceae bacterium]|nr:BrnT family toxin [Selenomonadaceae bacterium]
MRKNIAGRWVEWDDTKYIVNLEKHGVAFEDAAQIFLDESRIEYTDDLHSHDEERFITIGRVKKILFVVYTERGDTTRLISARKANKMEREVYYGASLYL